MFRFKMTVDQWMSWNLIVLCVCLHMCEGTIDAEAYEEILDRHAAIKATTFLEKPVAVLAGQCQNLLYTCYNSVTL